MAKKALNFVVLSLEVAGVGALVQPVYFGWNDGPRALPSDGGQHITRVVGLVAYDRARWLGQGGHWGSYGLSARSAGVRDSCRQLLGITPLV
jgi:hypothetical protein